MMEIRKKKKTCIVMSHKPLNYYLILAYATEIK